jgi:hypothetical protein
MNKEQKKRKQLLQEYNESIEEKERGKEIVHYVKQIRGTRPAKDIPFEEYFQNEIDSETIVSSPDCGDHMSFEQI